MPEYVFVYGTLKKGHFNSYLLDGSEYIADGVINNAVLIDLGGFPGLALGYGTEENTVHGEIYEIYRPRTLDMLDLLESEGRLYKRVNMSVNVIGNQQPILCWVYILLLNLSGALLVPDGNWRQDARV